MRNRCITLAPEMILVRSRCWEPLLYSIRARLFQVSWIPILREGTFLGPFWPTQMPCLPWSQAALAPIGPWACSICTCPSVGLLVLSGVTSQDPGTQKWQQLHSKGKCVSSFLPATSPGHCSNMTHIRISHHSECVFHSPGAAASLSSKTGSLVPDISVQREA